MLDIEKCSADLLTLVPLGHTLQEIADLHGVTRQRVHQVMQSRCPDLQKVGMKVRAEKRREVERAKQVLRYGMMRKEVVAIRRECKEKGLPDPFNRYRLQENNAHKRSLNWGFTFATWWEVWKNDFHRRGRGLEKLSMCRFNDAGGYAPGNVYLATLSQNLSDYWERRKTPICKK